MACQKNIGKFSTNYMTYGSIHAHLYMLYTDMCVTCIICMIYVSTQYILYAYIILYFYKCL